MEFLVDIDCCYLMIKISQHMYIHDFYNKLVYSIILNKKPFKS